MLVAQGLLLPHIQKQLGGHAPAIHLVQQLHGSAILALEGHRSGKAQAELALGHVHRFGDMASGAIMEAGLGRQRHRRASLKGDLFQEHLRHLLRCPGAYIEKFHLAFPEDTLVMLPQPLCGDGSHLLRLSQPGNAKGIGGAHIFQQTAHGIHLLVVPVAFNGGDEILLFAVHIAAEEAPLLHRGTKQQLPEEVRPWVPAPCRRAGRSARP